MSILVNPWRITNYYLNAGNATVTLYRAAYQSTAGWVAESSATVAATVPTNAGKGKYYLIAIKVADGTLETVAGSEYAYGGPDVSQIPDCPSTHTGLYVILTYQGMTVFNSSYIWDARLNSIPASATGGTGDVVGPGSAVDGNLAAFDGVAGKLLKDSGYSVANLIAAISASEPTDLFAGRLWVDVT